MSKPIGGVSARPFHERWGSDGGRDEDEGDTSAAVFADAGVAVNTVSNAKLTATVAVTVRLRATNSLASLCGSISPPGPVEVGVNDTSDIATVIAYQLSDHIWPHPE